MFRRWVAGHRALFATLTSGTVVAALIATAAIVSTGYTAQRLDLSDGAVWVVNGEQRALGRANTEVLELNTVVETTGNNLDVLQSGSIVLLVDRLENKVELVDPAASEVLESIALPPNQPEIFLAGDRVVIVEGGTGEVWILGINDLPSFDAESDSSLSLGTDAIVSVDPDGLMFAYSPSSGLIYRVDASISDSVESSQEVDFGADAGDLTISSVAGRWVVLDATNDRLFVEDGSIDLSSIVGAGSGAVLPQPTAAGGEVLIAYSGGLVSLPVGGATARQIVDGTSGVAARAVTIGDCSFAAWTNGDSWRRCAGDSVEGGSVRLQGISGNARLSYRVNGPLTVLNDGRSGKTWAVQQSSQLIDNWDDLIVTQEDEPEDQQNDENLPPQEEKVQLPPVAVGDAFGARPGRSTVLPVLLNDYDPNGDVLVISDLAPISEAIGRIDLINERQQIQLTLATTASGTVTFPYTVTDGRGGSATGTVVVTVRGPNENSPPEQVRSTKASVPSGGRITNQILGDWVDPDGDPFYLTNASVAAPDAVSSKPGGTIVFSDSGSGSDLKIVTLVVSDGSDEASGSVSVSVKPVGEVEIVADPFVVLAYAGQEVTVSPLSHVRGGNGTIRLNSVPSKTDVTITPSYETGTFRFSSDTVKSYYLDYVVTDGTQTVTGVVRVDVLAPPNANTKPITVPKTVFVQTLRNERVDVAGTDVDPAGGVLLVTGLANLDPTAGVRAEVLEQRIVRVSLEKPLDDGPVSFTYRISNGLAEADGVITVIEIPSPSRVQPPIAYDDSVTVRVGEAIDIPVLGNDEHPDGLDLTLQPKLDQALPPDSGLLFASGRVLRYLAPDKTGNFTAAYSVTGPDGQAATALVRIAVREADEATNNPPVPPTVTARVIAGETVRITIPLAGTDPDGDSVQLLGQSTNPERGSVLSVESDTIIYQAGDYSAGTDTFSYTVIDSLGARSNGTVRVGISPRLGARNPVAIVDVVTVRPGFTVSVQVLANDSDPDGSPLSIISATPNDPETTTEIVGDVIDVTPPREPGDYGVIYAIENDKGGTSQNFIRVTVDPDAPLAYPVASDSVLTLSDVLDRDQITVDVLANVFFADGDTRDLGLSIYPGFGSSAQVTSNKRVEVTIGDTSQIIPFKVTHPEDPTVFSYAFIRVPGFSDALPQIDRRADSLRVVSGQELTIELNDYIVAVGGKQVRLTTANSVRATHADGSSLVVDEDTLVFRSADKYFGPASISFEVTDGASASDPNGRTAILVLPITVLPRENQPPDFNGAAIDFEPGQEKIIDLLKLTSYPYPDDLDELVYTELAPLPEGFTSVLNGSLLTLRANENAVKGSTTALAMSVRDAVAEGNSGRIQLTIVGSTRPLLKPAPDSAIAKRGTTTTVDVLANDQATNPFPGKPLRVMDIRGLDGGALPAGITIEPSADRSTLTVTASAAAVPGDVNLQYQVADATNDPDRYVWGSITVSIQDRPDPVSNLAPTGFGDRTITMRWNAGPFNNSPITNYRVTSTLGGSVVDVANCTGTTCTIRTPGNGPSNGVIVSVVATNAIGDSDAYTLSSPVWSDIIPPAPTGLTSAPLDHGLRVSWNAVATPAGGSPVQSYLVTVGGVVVNPSTSVCSGGVCTTDVVDGSLANGVAVSYTVSARNGAYTALSVWNTSEPQSGVPAGPPIAGSSPLATATTDTSISVDWGGVFNNNGRAITSYWVASYTSTAPTCSPDGTLNANGANVQATGTGTSAGFGGLSPNSTYSIIVFAFNGQGCSPSPAVIAHTPPPVISSISASIVPSGDGTWDLQFDGGTVGGDNLSNGYSIIYSLSGGSVVGGERGPIGVGGLFTADGSQYGSNIAVSARACRTYDSGPLCQPVASGSQSIGMPVNANVRGLAFTPSAVPLEGTFTWLGYPLGDYSSVEYSCSGQGWTAVSDWNNTPGGSCVASGLLQVQLDIRVTTPAGSYIKTYYANTIAG